MVIVIEKNGYRVELEEKGDLVKCPKCGRASWKPYLTKRTGKNPMNAYYYFEFRHRKDGRTGKNKHCYLPAVKAEHPEGSGKVRPEISKGG
jgi:hypothetical protein